MRRAETAMSPPLSTFAGTLNVKTWSTVLAVMVSVSPVARRSTQVSAGNFVALMSLESEAADAHAADKARASTVIFMASTPGCRDRASRSQEYHGDIPHR